MHSMHRYLNQVVPIYFDTGIFPPHSTYWVPVVNSTSNSKKRLSRFFGVYYTFTNVGYSEVMQGFQLDVNIPWLGNCRLIE